MLPKNRRIFQNLARSIVKEKERTESVDKKINVDDVEVHISMDVPELSPEGKEQLRKAIEWLIEIDKNKEELEKLKEKARRDLGITRLN